MAVTTAGNSNNRTESSTDGNGGDDGSTNSSSDGDSEGDGRIGTVGIVAIVVVLVLLATAVGAKVGCMVQRGRQRKADATTLQPQPQLQALALVLAQAGVHAASGATRGGDASYGPMQPQHGEEVAACTDDAYITMAGPACRHGHTDTNMAGNNDHDYEAMASPKRLPSYATMNLRPSYQNTVEGDTGAYEEVNANKADGKRRGQQPQIITTLPPLLQNSADICDFRYCVVHQTPMGLLWNAHL